jgi:hypothetical protein
MQQHGMSMWGGKALEHEQCGIGEQAGTASMNNMGSQKQCGMERC